MAFSLHIQPLHGVQAYKKTFDQDAVLLGRDMNCDLMLQDTKSLVSREHAVIRKKLDHYCLVDLESKNQTKLNQHILKPGQSYPLKTQDLIRIGDFELTITEMSISNTSPATDQGSLSKDASQNTHDHPETNNLATVLHGLNQVFASHRDQTNDIRQEALLRVLRKSLHGLAPEMAQKQINQVEAAFQSAETAPAVATHVPGDSNLNLEGLEATPLRQAYKGLLKIAEPYFETQATLNTVEGIAQLTERIEKVLSVALSALSKSLKGRREFAEKFDVEATRILSWRFNPVKECESGEKIGAYLLDSEKEPSLDTGIKNLEESYSDLALHQLGLIAALNESQRALLDQLLPDRLEVASQKTGAISTWLRPLIRFEPFRSWAAWKHFRKTYKTLREEEVKTFETILGPYIAKGYLAVQKKKPTP